MKTFIVKAKNGDFVTVEAESHSISNFANKTILELHINSLVVACFAEWEYWLEATDEDGDEETGEPIDYN